MRAVNRFQQIVMTMLLTIAAAIPLLAQDRAPGPDAFRPVSPDELGQEQLPATPLVFSAYAIVWVVLLVYVFTLTRKMKRLERDLQEVTAKTSARR